MRLATSLVLAGLLLGAATAPAAPARPARAAKRPAADGPFWAGHPDSGAFRRANQTRLTRAGQAIDRLLAVRGARTIANTLQPYDDALLELDAVASQASLMENVHPDSNLRKVAEVLTQRASSFATDLSLNRKVYDALAALDLSKTDPETKYYVEKTLRDFRLSGVDRDDATRDRIRRLNEELVETGQAFERNIREGSRTFKVQGPDALAGLPADFVENHKPAADGSIELSIEYPDYFPVLTYAKREDVRKKMYMEANQRAYPENMAVLDSLLAKRHRLANLLGYPTWAEYITADKMSGSARAASDFIARIVDASAERAKSDYAKVLARKRQDVPNADHVDWWDRFYWPELVRQKEYDFDQQLMRPYFPYDRVKQGVLDISAKMFGVTFRRVANAPVWDPSVECWEMVEKGRLVGRFYLDMHPREDKYNHAAQFDVRTGVEGRQIPEAALVCNLPGGKPGDPGLMGFEDVNTFFHEFGHLLHTLFAGHHHWVGIGGIRTEHDFVEAPSQMLEEWMLNPGVLRTFAKNEAGQAIPVEMVEKLKRSREFGQGLDVRRQMVLADYSLSIYNRDPKTVNSDSLFKQLTERYTFYPFVPGTHFQTAFGHLEGYSAVYYTYMWSLVIAKDMFSRFDPKDLLDPAVATRYRNLVLAPGGSAPAATLVEHFLGRPFGFEAWKAWLNGGEPMPVNP